MKVLRVRICFIYSFDLESTSLRGRMRRDRLRVRGADGERARDTALYARFDPALTSCCCNLCQGWRLTS